jgi:hypothetical protein
MLEARERDCALAFEAGREQGRADASAMWAPIADEARMEGWQEARNQLARRLREMARDDPAARAILLDVLR